MKWMLAALLVLSADYEKLLKEATYSLSEAIDKGLKEAKEGVVVKIDLEQEKGKVIYSMDVAQGSKILEVNLSAKTGEVVETDTENEDQSKLVQAAKITLKQAIEAALKKAPGKAVAAELEMKDAKVQAEVKVFADGKVQKVYVDGTTGQVTAIKELEKKQGGKKEDDDDDD